MKRFLLALLFHPGPVSFRTGLVVAVLAFHHLAFTIYHSAAAAAPPNVLFIAYDDLRPTLACYGDPLAITPNFDRLAAQGTLFERAYCQLAVCAPSRLSLLTGRRPDTIKVWDLKTHFREEIPHLVTLPQHFKNNGYHSRAIGKILHGSSVSKFDPPSWSEDPMYDDGRRHSWRYAAPENLKVDTLKRTATEAEDVPDSVFVDGKVCDEAEQALVTFKGTGQPFFLAIGFRKPHLPFVAPKKYWDLYDRSQIPSPPSRENPSGAPEFGTRTWRELEGYTDIPMDLAAISDEQVQELRHGYYACVSYVDALLGRLLDKLEELALDGNTIICLWGDHGFHLGEQGLWTKANNYELSARVPLIVYDPRRPANGARSSALVELVDLYPTLADLCALEVSAELEGLSFAPLLENPVLPWKTAAFHQYPRDYVEIKHKRHGDVMGYALRTSRYRYVQWKDWEFGDILKEELYDQEIDPHEMRNLAHNPENKQLVEQLRGQLAAGWRGALPK